MCSLSHSYSVLVESAPLASQTWCYMWCVLAYVRIWRSSLLSYRVAHAILSDSISLLPALSLSLLHTYTRSLAHPHTTLSLSRSLAHSLSHNCCSLTALFTCCCAVHPIHRPQSIQSILTDELGMEDLRWMSGFIITKPPHSPSLGWHQDTWYIPRSSQSPPHSPTVLPPESWMCLWVLCCGRCATNQVLRGGTDAEHVHQHPSLPLSRLRTLLLVFCFYIC